MFTVKLQRMNPALELGAWSTKIVETSEVDIHIIKPGLLKEIAGKNSSGEYFAFFLANPKEPEAKEGFANEVEFWDSAYIENAAGATTEVVSF